MLVTASPVTTWPASRRISTLRLKIISQLEASAVGSLHRGIICSFAFLCRAETEAHGCAEGGTAFDLLVNVTNAHLPIGIGTPVVLDQCDLLIGHRRLERGRPTASEHIKHINPSSGSPSQKVPFGSGNTALPILGGARRRLPYICKCRLGEPETLALFAQAGTDIHADFFAHLLQHAVFCRRLRLTVKFFLTQRISHAMTSQVQAARRAPRGR